MLGEDMGDKHICNINGSDCIRSWNKDTFLRKAVYIHQDSRDPLDGGSCSMKSMHMECQGRSGIGSGGSKPKR